MRAQGFRTARARTVLALCGLLLLAALTVAPLLGPHALSLERAFHDQESADHDILFGARLPRTLFAALAGGLLAAAGVSFQAVLRNPLACPFTLGVSSGGALGAVIALRFGWDRGGGAAWPAVPAAALAGALAVVALVGALGRTRRGASPLTLLLAGVIVNFTTSSLILLVLHQADLAQSYLMVRWTMGALDVFGYRPLLASLGIALVGLALIAPGRRHLNALSVGEDWARSRGTDVRRVASRQYLGASLLTAAVVAYAGPIGFVGLVVPHALRLVCGADHRVVLPAALLAGGAFLVACDTVARTALAPAELPVGIVTSLLGGPFFLWLLLARRREAFF